MTKPALLACCLLVALPPSLAAQRQSLPEEPPSELSPTVASNGRQMFLTYCAPCHGRDGKGDGPVAKTLKSAPADLTRITIRNGGTFPLMKIRQYIEGLSDVQAHGTRDMPLWGSLFIGADRDPGLKDLRITNLANYVKALQKKK